MATTEFKYNLRILYLFANWHNKMSFPSQQQNKIMQRIYHVDVDHLNSFILQTLLTFNNGYKKQNYIYFLVLTIKMCFSVFIKAHFCLIS